ncbi:MAG: rhamnogalacturonan acetylesterase [Cyclobacteriaceae bacterium]
MKIFFFIFCIMVSWSESPGLTIYLIGDSTMSTKEINRYPETGWGMPFQHFFDSSVTVENHAKNGRSTSSFLREKRWQPIFEKLKPEDYVLIQFGHNDEVKSKQGRYTTPEEYVTNLARYVNETREKGATPILLSPVTRRKFDREGHVKLTHPERTPLVKQLADSMNVSYINADLLTRNLLQRFGEEDSKLLFLQLNEKEHPNYPAGIVDNTHFNELGARLVAQEILQAIRSSVPELRDRIVNNNEE